MVEISFTRNSCIYPVIKHYCVKRLIAFAIDIRSQGWVFKQRQTRSQIFFIYVQLLSNCVRDSLSKRFFEVYSLNPFIFLKFLEKNMSLYSLHFIMFSGICPNISSII